MTTAAQFTDLCDAALALPERFPDGIRLGSATYTWVTGAHGEPEHAVGGFSVVFHVQNQQGEHRALKVIAPPALGFAMDPGSIAEDASLEATVLTDVHIDGVPRLLSGENTAQTVDGLHVLVLEWAPGEHLPDYCQRMRTALRDPDRPTWVAWATSAWKVAARLASMLTQFHEQLHGRYGDPVAHGDIKPGNIKVHDPNFPSTVSPDVWLLDLGSAAMRLRGSQSSTPGETAPEVDRGEPATPKSDQYQLGRIVESLLEPLESALETMGPWGHLQLLLLHPITYWRVRRLSSIAARMRRASPSGRFQTMRKVLAAVSRPLLSLIRDRRFVSEAVLLVLVAVPLLGILSAAPHFGQFWRGAGTSAVGHSDLAKLVWRALVDTPTSDCSEATVRAQATALVPAAIPSRLRAETVDSLHRWIHGAFRGEFAVDATIEWSPAFIDSHGGSVATIQFTALDPGGKSRRELKVITPVPRSIAERRSKLALEDNQTFLWLPGDSLQATITLKPPYDMAHYLVAPVSSFLRLDQFTSTLELPGRIAPYSGDNGVAYKPLALFAFAALNIDDQTILPIAPGTWDRLDGVRLQLHVQPSQRK